jgi:hypothetical protein
METPPLKLQINGIRFPVSRQLYSIKKLKNNLQKCIKIPPLLAVIMKPHGAVICDYPLFIDPEAFPLQN